MLRIGFVGSGLIAWAHGLSLKALIDGGVVDAAIVAVHDQHERRARGFADIIGGDDVAVVGDAAEVARRCDVIWVCTPTAAHRGAVDEALSAGCAVFCEKPLDVNLVEATELVEVVRASGVASQSGLVLRSAPVFRALRDLVAGGSLGAPMAAVFRDDQYFPIQGTYASQWRGDVSQAGGGCLIEHSIHDLDILRFCFGDVDSVVARTANHAGHEGIEDLAAVTLSFASGFEAQLTSVWHDILSRGSTRRLEVFCREGMVWLDEEFRGPLHIQTSDGTEDRACPSPPWVDALPLADDEVGLAVRAYVEADRAFLDAVADGRPPSPGLDVALDAHRLVDAAYRSAAHGGAPIGLSTRG
jgi:myo-inositol 2-dehydrogenase/D-chiro-inositol 1-dehydrogenase